MSSTSLRRLIIVLLGVGIFAGSVGIAWAQSPDPNGAETLAKDATSAVNFSWTLIAAFLVFFMQAGFAFLGAGLIRSKNVVNYMTKSYLDFCIAALSFWAFGFALMFGGSAVASGLGQGNSIIGYSGFFLSGDAYDVTTIMIWIFQMVFAGTAATI